MKTSTVLCLASALATGVLPPLAAHAQEKLGTSADPLIVSPGPGPADRCKQGFVWREARPGDHVCVTPATRAQVAQQNRDAARLWVKGAYGPHTCVAGYVWREAFKGDTVCVQPEVRTRTHQDNAAADRRRVGG